MARALAWIRRDLRLSDHAALTRATELADEVAVVFVFDTQILNALPDRADRRVTFIHQSLQEIDKKLRKRGSQLLVRHGDPQREIPAVARALKVQDVVTARDYEPYARDRDLAVGEALKADGIRFRTVKDSVVMEAGQVKSQAGGVFRVFTPYSRAWRKAFQAETDGADFTPDLSRLMAAEEIAPHVAPWAMEDLAFQSTDLWLAAGEEAGLQRLTDFERRLADYEEARNFPAIDGTSGLSVHLRFGTVSPRECVRRAFAQGAAGEKWLTELIWRDFYQDVLRHHPQVVAEPFQPQYKGLPYPGEESHWQAWCAGQTGFPIVDAAMRCLNQTGWMHNRLRMITASFLTKDLLISYQRGEQYFADKLLDFDLASNNGGWQWAASTGADAQPYFRIFNPTLQSERYDPDGTFIRAWVPELAALDGKAIHAPAEHPGALRLAGIELGRDYAAPIVNHSTQKERALELLSSVRK